MSEEYDDDYDTLCDVCEQNMTDNGACGHCNCYVCDDCIRNFGGKCPACSLV